MFSDELTVYLNAHEHCQNVRYESEPNRHWMEMSHFQGPQTNNVWMGIISNRVIWLYFYSTFIIFGFISAVSNS